MSVNITVCSLVALMLAGSLGIHMIPIGKKDKQAYIESLDVNQRKVYDQIIKDRARTARNGFMLGALLSVVWWYFVSNRQTRTVNFWCAVAAIIMLVTRVWYTLAPKADWIVAYSRNSEQIKLWLKSYRAYQVQHTLGMLLAIIGFGLSGAITLV